MEHPALKILLVEDSSDDAALLLGALKAGGLRVTCHRVDSRSAMEDALREPGWDVVLCDCHLPRFRAKDALSVLKRSGLDLPLIVVSGYVGEDAAVELVKEGATDFVVKSNLARLVPAIERSIRETRTRHMQLATEEALRKSDERFKALASNIPGVVFLAMFAPDGSIRIAYMSPNCQLLFGMTADAMIARPQALADLVVPADWASFLRSLLESQRDDAQLNWEGRIVLQDETVKWVNLRASVRALATGEFAAEGLIINITNGKLAERAALQSQQELRALSSHLQKVQEEERARIAREIHDEIGSILTAAKSDLSTLDRGLPPERTDLVIKAVSVDNLLDQAMEAGNRIARSLRPGVLDYGTAAAIEWQVREFEKRMEIPCVFDCSNDDLQLAPELSTALFRIFQETLTNISKHARAHQVRVELLDRANQVVLRVADDGRGISDTDLTKTGSFGINCMRERARHLGGRLRVARRAEGGTEVEVTLPCERDADHDMPSLDQLTLFDSK